MPLLTSRRRSLGAIVVVGFIAVVVWIVHEPRPGNDAARGVKPVSATAMRVDRAGKPCVTLGLTDCATSTKLPSGTYGPTTALASRIAAMKTGDGALLLALFTAGMSNSATLDDQYMASQVKSYCNGYVNPRTIDRDAAASRDTVAAEEVRLNSVRDRIDVMAARCAPLATIGGASWRKAALSWSKALSAKDSPFRQDRFVSSDSKSLDPQYVDDARQGIREELDKHGAVALDWTGGALLALTGLDKKHSPSSSWFADKNVTAIAISMAACYAHQPCGADALPTIGVCVGTAGLDCGDDLTQEMLAGLPSEGDRKQAAKLAQQIAAAIAARDWQQLGLSAD